MHSFSEISAKRLATCDPRLIELMNRAIRVTEIDFGIAEGHRSVEKQQEYFKAGKSRIDGIKTIGKHNYNPSRAVDIYGYVNGKADYSEPVMRYLAELILSIAGEMSIRVQWGGNWKTFVDMPHFELI